MRTQISEEINFRKLEVLLAYIEGGNLNSAAQMLDTSAVSVHRALHSLERSMSCQLFSHSGRNLVPNDAAHVLAAASREVIKRMTDGIVDARRAAGQADDRLRIGSLYSLATGTTPEVIVGIRLRRPDLRTELAVGTSTDLLCMLKQATIDAALMTPPDPDPDIETIPLFDHGILFAAPAGSPYAREPEIDLRQCGGEKFVSLNDGFANYGGYLQAVCAAGFSPAVVMQVADIFSLMSLVSAGIGYSLLPASVRGMFGDRVQLIPLRPEYRMCQSIGLSFLRVRERDPNLLALAAVCRMLRHVAR